MVKISDDLFDSLIENYAENDLVGDYGHNDVTEFLQTHPEMLSAFLSDMEDSEINTEFLEEICNNSVLLTSYDNDSVQEFVETLNLDIDLDELLDADDFENTLFDAMDQEGVWYKTNNDGIVAVIPHY